MREIKFRAWDKKQEFMEINGLYMSFLNGGLKVDGSAYYLSNGWVEGNINKEIKGMENIEPDVILMQYTGLKDKNGKEIYEGDIIRTLDLGNTPGEVVWRQEVCAFELMINEKVYTIDDVTKFEIIGNIYENPELHKRHC